MRCQHIMYAWRGTKVTKVTEGKKARSVILLLVLGSLLLVDGAAARAEGGLPAKFIFLNTPPAGWQVAEAPQAVEGPALFAVINGGAELYLELGFKQAAFAAYKTDKGILLNLEIYEMVSPEAARKTQASKTGGQDRPETLGDEARWGDHYLNLRKGPWQVTIAGYDTKSVTLDGIRALAETVVRNLNGAS